MSGLPAPEPVITADTRPFWEATTHERLLLRRCEACKSFIWYPRPICPHCSSLDTSWVEASGRGTIYSYTVVRRAPGAYAGALPYALAYVELEEGVRVLTNIVGGDVEALRVGQPVRVVFDDTEAGAALPRYTPVGRDDA